MKTKGIKILKGSNEFRLYDLCSGGNLKSFEFLCNDREYTFKLRKHGIHGKSTTGVCYKSSDFHKQRNVLVYFMAFRDGLITLELTSSCEGLLILNFGEYPRKNIFQEKISEIRQKAKFNHYLKYFPDRKASTVCFSPGDFDSFTYHETQDEPIILSKVPKYQNIKEVTVPHSYDITTHLIIDSKFDMKCTITNCRNIRVHELQIRAGKHTYPFLAIQQNMLYDSFNFCFEKEVSSVEFKGIYVPEPFRSNIHEKIVFVKQLGTTIRYINGETDYT